MELGTGATKYNYTIKSNMMLKQQSYKTMLCEAEDMYRGQFYWFPGYCFNHVSRIMVILQSLLDYVEFFHPSLLLSLISGV